MEAICCTTGASITAGAVSARMALPLDSKGRIPASVRVSTLASAAVHVVAGDENVAATSSGLLLCNGRDIVINTSGLTHIAVIQAGLGLGGIVNVVSYE